MRDIASTERSVAPARHWLLVAGLAAAAGVLLARAGYLQLYNRDFLLRHGDARAVRDIEQPAHRGMIADRNGVPLAVSTPVQSLVATPRELLKAEAEDLTELARLLGKDPEWLRRRLRKNTQRDFLYLRRHATPEWAKKALALELPGVYSRREYRRYYPSGEITAQVLGFTNVDDRGQEGVEAAYDDWLQGKAGSMRVIKDRRGRTIRSVEIVRPPQPGKTLVLSIDRRLQYLAYRELKAAVQSHRAAGGTLVILDPRSGEVLAMVNQPSYNPNDRASLGRDYYRNASVTDAFEPGSTIKPFAILAALLSGRYQPSSTVDTHPGYLRVANYTIRDIRNYGTLDLSGIVKRSSNVGISKVALGLEPEQLWDVFDQVGFGRLTGSNFPGETGGILPHYLHWNEVEQAAAAYGYGISLTALQLARAYSALATGGILPPATLIKRDASVDGRQVLPAWAADEIKAMLEEVVRPTGTGRRAAVARYRIAGKTGTVRKSLGAQGYSDEAHLALFVGIAPVSAPQLAMVVVIDSPTGDSYYGGGVAAPVFSNVMAGSLRLLNVPPDNLAEIGGLQIVGQGSNAFEYCAASGFSAGPIPPDFCPVSVAADSLTSEAAGVPEEPTP